MLLLLFYFSVQLSQGDACLHCDHHIIPETAFLNVTLDFCLLLKRRNSEQKSTTYIA